MIASGCQRDDPAQLAKQAQSEWKSGRLAQAEAALARLARVRPLSLEERLMRSQVARELGRIDDAVAALGDVLETDPRAAVIASSRGTLELVRHRFRDAEKFLLHALELDPKRVEARRELINLYALQGRLAECRAQFHALARNAPLSFADLYLWTLGRREDAGPAQLAQTLSLAVNADDGDRFSRLALAENLRRLGLLAQAEAALEPLPESDPDVRAAKARILLDRGDPHSAETLLTSQGNAVEVGHVPTLRLLGRMALDRGDAPAAIRYLSAALKRAPDDRDAEFQLGQAFRLARDTEAARSHVQAAVDRDHLEWLVQNAAPPSLRGDSKALRPIAEACATRSRNELARAWYRLALESSPLDTELQKAIFQLDAKSRIEMPPAD